MARRRSFGNSRSFTMRYCSQSRSAPCLATSARVLGAYRQISRPSQPSKATEVIPAISAASPQASKGWRLTMVSARSGPVEMMSMGRPDNSSILARYRWALAGRSATWVAPTVDSVQPGISR